MTFRHVSGPWRMRRARTGRAVRTWSHPTWRSPPRRTRESCTYSRNSWIRPTSRPCGNWSRCSSAASAPTPPAWTRIGNVWRSRRKASWTGQGLWSGGPASPRSNTREIPTETTVSYHEDPDHTRMPPELSRENNMRKLYGNCEWELCRPMMWFSFTTTPEYYRNVSNLYSLVYILLCDTWRD